LYHPILGQHFLFISLDTFAVGCSYRSATINTQRKTEPLTLPRLE